MKDEIMLKQKYNDLLESFKTGSDYLLEHPEEVEKVQKRLEEISKEMENVIKAIPNATDEEKANGFAVEVVTEVEEKPCEIEESKNTQVVVRKQESISLEESFSNDWQMATQLAKSDILPDNYKNKPQNIVIAVRTCKTNGFTTIYSNAKFSNYSWQNCLEWIIL